MPQTQLSIHNEASNFIQVGIHRYISELNWNLNSENKTTKQENLGEFGPL